MDTDKRQMIDKLEQALPSARALCKYLRGFIVYGSFVSGKDDPHDIDILLLYDKDSCTGVLDGDFGNSYAAESARKYVSKLDPRFHVNRSTMTYLETPDMVRCEFGFWNIKSYYFIGDEEARKQLKDLITFSELLSF